MKNSTIRRVMVFGAFSVLSLIAVQTYWVLRTWDLQEREFDRKVNVALLETAHDLKKMHGFELPTQNLIDQPYSNYYTVNINNMFDPSTVEYYLRKSFENQGLREDFQYGVFDCSSNQMVTGQTVRYNSNRAEKLVEPLPAHYSSDFIYYFGVRFVNKSTNILSNMWIVVVFTVLVAMTVGFFVYTVYIILRQKHLSELQRDFINNMTHEFKTPISTINISTDVFLNHPTIQADARLERYAGIIKQQVMRLNTQVEKVLQLAKIEREQIQLNLENFDLAEMVKSISPSLELKVAEAKGSLELQLDAAHTRITADRLHLTNILHNLVDNAVKYTRGEPKILIRLKNEGVNLLLEVQDNGIGIPKEHLKKVFERFHRVPTGNVHNVKGFGLGLFYVKTICREHGWRIHINSEVGQGTTISIQMKLARE